MRKFSRFVVASSLTVLLAACGDNDTKTADDAPKSDFRALFSLTDAVVPAPNNLFFYDLATLQVVEDKTLNLPPDVDTDNDGTNDALSPPRQALNALDGFSTVAPFSTTFASAIAATSLNGSSIRLYEVTLTGTGGAPIAIQSTLQYGVDYAAGVSADGKTLAISPLKPLKPKTSYLIALTNALKSSQGDPAVADVQYSVLKREVPLTGPFARLEGLRPLVNQQEKLLAASGGVAKSDVVLSWTFTTQSVGTSLQAAKGMATATAGTFAPLGNTAPFGGQGVANLYAGTVELPYYLSAAASTTDNAILSTFWKQASGDSVNGVDPATTAVPVEQSKQKIPVLASAPVGAGPWPVVMFQHGITSNRSALIPIADTLAKAGFAAVAIDMPLHGIVPNHPQLGALRGATDAMGAKERLFDVDLLTQNAAGQTTAPGPDGTADSSGAHFINLPSLLTSRDNVQQAVADLIAMTKAIPNIDLDGGGADLDADRIHFIGHSLGGIVGSTFLAQMPEIKASVLAMPGGGIAKILDGSETFGPVIAAGLAAQGVERGTSNYEAFMMAAQSAVDAADPINFGAETATGRGILMLEVLGDKVVPNSLKVPVLDNVVPSFTAGTEPLAAVQGLPGISATAQGEQLKGLVRFSQGTHASILVPGDTPAVTAQMQATIATFLATDGAQIELTDTSAISGAN